MRRAKRQLRDAVVDAAARGLTIAEAAEELDVAYSTVHSVAWHARKAGLMPVYFTTAPRGAQPRRENAGHLVAEVKQAAVHMRRTGATEAEIAEELGITEARVGVLLRQRRLRIAMRRERLWLALTGIELGEACGTTKAVVFNHERGLTVWHLERFLRALADMREGRLRRIAEELSDRGNPVPHVLDVQEADDLDDALDKVRALDRAEAVALSDREAEALGLWARDYTQAEAGARMGVTGERVRQLVRRALRRMRGDDASERLEMAAPVMPSPRPNPTPYRGPRRRVGPLPLARVTVPVTAGG